MRISDWSSDVCSSDLLTNRLREQLWRYYPQMIDVAEDLAAGWVLELWKLVPTPAAARRVREHTLAQLLKRHRVRRITAAELLARLRAPAISSEEHTSELQSLMRNSYAVFCLKK